jgi:hypothetical protein
MTISKKLLAVAAAAALTAATAVPALALENEFHGMYRVFLSETNFNNGYPPGAGLRKDAASGFVVDQRARIMYIAKANDDLKLVTHFELDTRFGGTAPANGYKGIPGGSDAGQLDADSISLETKNVYLDFNIPNTGVNMKVGVQPWADSYQWIFAMADMAGVYATKKFDPLTVSLGWFRFADQGTNGANAVALATTTQVGKLTSDMIVVDGKFAVNKDITVGASYYNVQRDNPGIANGTAEFELLHMVGLNASVKAGPAVINPFFAYQFGDANPTGAAKNDISAFLAGLTSKTKVGPGTVNLSGFYTSGDKDGISKNKDFKILGAGTDYFGAANMWLLLRHPIGISTQTVLDVDNSARDRGLMGVFAGYEGTAGKVFYAANVGYMKTAEQRTNAAGIKEANSIGTEINAQIGYKMFDSMSASLNAAYLLLGDGLESATPGKRIANLGAANADDPYLINVCLNYAF